MTSKRYIACVGSILYVFMIINLILWHGITKDIFGMKDLNRMGYILAEAPLTEDRHYSKHHTEFIDYIASGMKESFDVLTIGDSFTNGRDGGSYPDYLVNEYGLKVINARMKNHCLDDLYMLLTSGVIDELKPRAVIIESVERSVQYRLGKYEVQPLNVSRGQIEDIAMTDILRNSDKRSASQDGIFAPVMVRWSIMNLYAMIYRLFRPWQLSPEVYIAELDRPFFTNHGQERTLLHYFEDLDYLTDPLNTDMVNRNLNNAARLLKAKGIKLIFFAAADKYDLYYPYIIDKRGRPENPFFTKMREVQGKEYIFLDAMTPLREALARGEQDIYWLGDTHWSHKGIKVVCDELVKYILP